MGQFLSKITAQYNPPRKWIMKEDLTYICTELTEDETQALIQIGVKSLVNVKNEKEIKVEEKKDKKEDKVRLIDRIKEKVISTISKEKKTEKK